MPLPEAIAAHHAALARIVAGLFVLLGLKDACAPERIALKLHRAIARTLRPAESAARRLILWLAKGINPARLKPAAPRPMPSAIPGRSAEKSPAAFALFDPRPRLLFARRARKPPPARLRITFFGESETRTLDLAPPLRPAGDGLYPTAHLVRRLQALHSALENLPRQARRLARLLAQNAPAKRRKLAGPLRPGRPPGFRKRAREEIDKILHHCDWLAREALWDTS